MLKRLRKPGALSIIVALALIVALPASAVLLESGDDNGEDEVPLVSHDFDPDAHVLVFAVNEPGTEEPVDCTLPEGVVFEVDSEGNVTVGDGGTALENCTLLLAENQNGKTNHGQVVSAFVHALKAAFQEEGLQGSMPFGQYVKEIAGSDHGKKHADDDGDEDGVVESQAKGKNKVGKGKGKGKNK